jgi:hypothetical protein
MASSQTSRTHAMTSAGACNQSRTRQSEIDGDIPSLIFGISPGKRSRDPQSSWRGPALLEKKSHAQCTPQFNVWPGYWSTAHILPCRIVTAFCFMDSAKQTPWSNPFCFAIRRPVLPTEQNNPCVLASLRPPLRRDGDVTPKTLSAHRHPKTLG